MTKLLVMPSGAEFATEPLLRAGFRKGMHERLKI